MKQQIKQQFEKENAKVKSIRQYGNTFKVKIDWKDYPKVQHLVSDTIQITM